MACFPECRHKIQEIYLREADSTRNCGASYRHIPRCPSFTEFDKCSAPCLATNSFGFEFTHHRHLSICPNYPTPAFVPVPFLGKTVLANRGSDEGEKVEFGSGLELSEEKGRLVSLETISPTSPHNYGVDSQTSPATESKSAPSKVNSSADFPKITARNEAEYRYHQRQYLLRRGMPLFPQSGVTYPADFIVSMFPPEGVASPLKIDSCTCGDFRLCKTCLTIDGLLMMEYLQQCLPSLSVLQGSSPSTKVRSRTIRIHKSRKPSQTTSDYLEQTLGATSVKQSSSSISPTLMMAFQSATAAAEANPGGDDMPVFKDRLLHNLFPYAKYVVAEKDQEPEKDQEMEPVLDQPPRRLSEILTATSSAAELSASASVPLSDICAKCYSYKCNGDHSHLTPPSPELVATFSKPPLTAPGAPKKVKKSKKMFKDTPKKYKKLPLLISPEKAAVCGKRAREDTPSVSVSPAKRITRSAWKNCLVSCAFGSHSVNCPNF